MTKELFQALAYLAPSPEQFDVEMATKILKGIPGQSGLPSRLARAIAEIINAALEAEKVAGGAQAPAQPPSETTR